jgi:SAM-dependent methyltransferase
MVSGNDAVAPLHGAAATGFARSVDAYERGRPGYPDDAVDWLVARLGATRVADLAAGTGKLTAALAARGLHVVAIEPIAEMRAAIAPHEHVEVVDGRAEATGLGDASVDAVTVAQAFHWFDVPRALAEIHRVLRPGAVLALVFNRRRLEDDVHRRIQELLAPHRGDVPAHTDRGWHDRVDDSPLFEPLARREFDNVQVLDAQGLADRFGSVSFVAALEDDVREELLGELRALAGDATLTLRYRTDVEVLRRAARPHEAGAAPAAMPERARR